MNPVHTHSEQFSRRKLIYNLCQWGRSGLLPTLILLGSFTCISISAIRCEGVDQSEPECSTGKSCAITFEINTSNLTDVMRRNTTGKPSCKKDEAEGCLPVVKKEFLEIKCSCTVDLCNAVGRWDADVEKILQPYRRNFMTKQQKVNTQSTNDPPSTSSSLRSFAYSGTTLVFHTPKVPSSTMTTTEDPSEDLFWTHCEVIAILLVFFGIAAIGFILLTLLFTFEWSWKEKCCGKYRKKMDIEANLEGVVDGVAVKRPILKARRRVKKVPAAPQNVNPVEPIKVEESPLIPV